MVVQAEDQDLLRPTVMRQSGNVTPAPGLGEPAHGDHATGVVFGECWRGVAGTVSGPAVGQSERCRVFDAEPDAVQ